MKLVKRSHRVLAIIMGILVLVTLVVQILRDGRQMQFKTMKHYQSITK